MAKEYLFLHFSSLSPYSTIKLLSCVTHMVSIVRIRVNIFCSGQQMGGGGISALTIRSLSQKCPHLTLGSKLWCLRGA